MKREGYTPYCGDMECKTGMPRTDWNKEISQFECSCGWVSKIDKDFLKRYKDKWSK